MRRLCTMLPLPMMRTPLSRRAASSFASSNDIAVSEKWSRLICITGTSASGYKCLTTLQQPWSSPHLSSSPTSVFWSALCLIRQFRTPPFAGYCTSYSSLGKPPKSWIVDRFFHRCNIGASCFPVRRHAEYRLWFGQTCWSPWSRGQTRSLQLHSSGCHVP